MIAIDMPMPERCYSCPFSDGQYCIPMDQKKIDKMTWIRRRPSWCPLIDFSRLEDDGK